MSKPKIYTSLYHDHNGGALIVIFQRVPIKNFGNDIRASSDVEHFVKLAILFLALDETNLEAILDTMLEKLIDDDEPHATIHEAKMDLFTNDSGASKAPPNTTSSSSSFMNNHNVPRQANGGGGRRPESPLARRQSASNNKKSNTYFTYGERFGTVQNFHPTFFLALAPAPYSLQQLPN